jgi:hypothetical protein
MDDWMVGRLDVALAGDWRGGDYFAVRRDWQDAQEITVMAKHWIYGVFTPLFAASKESIFKVMQYEH